MKMNVVMSFYTLSHTVSLEKREKTNNSGPLDGIVTFISTNNHARSQSNKY